MNTIEKGQYWIVEGDSVALVIGRNLDNTCWLTNRLDKRGGFASRVGVADHNFNRQISVDDAKEKAFQHLRQKLEEFFELA